MRAATLLARLRAQGVTVADDRGQLVLEEAGAPLPDDLLDEVRAAKADLLALLRREAAEAVEATRPETPDAGPPWDQPGPWRWVNPENSAEDLALLAAIERLDRVLSPTTSPDKAESSCYGCASRDWWRSRHGGHLVCRRCHPPVPGAEVAEVLAVAAAGAKEGA